MECNESKIVVITPTVGRIEQIERCIASVKAQDTTFSIRHIVVGDHLDDKKSRDVNVLCEKLGVQFINDERPRQTSYGPARASMTRNFGIAVSRESYIAHLDEDNTFEPNHLSSLGNLLDRNPDVDIAHSWRRVLGENGKPCQLHRYPWVIFHNEVLAREVFEWLSKEGIFEDGSEIIRDRMDNISPDLCHIDSSELMMRREIFSKVLFQEEYTAREMIYQYTEDFLFCRAAQEARLVFACSEQATLNYYLGGYSSSPQKILEK